ELHARLAAIGRAEPAAFELPFSQEVLGDALGLSVPHLNRMMSQLRFEGLVRFTNRRVEFPDLEAIRVRAQFQPLNLTRIPAMVWAAAGQPRPNSPRVTAPARLRGTRPGPAPATHPARRRNAPRNATGSPAARQPRTRCAPRPTP